MIRARLLPLVLVSLLALPSCEKPAPTYGPFVPPSDRDYDRALPPGALALRKIPPEQYPDFRPGFINREGLERAINYSLQYMAKPSSRKYYPYGDISHERARASLVQFLQVLQSSRSPEEFDQAIKSQFDVYESVGYDGEGTVFFTGYYTPIFDARRQRDREFRYPLYRLPPDLVKDEEGNTLGRRVAGGGVVPGYPTRRQIEEGRLLDGLELVYLRNPFEAYIVNVQGSARLRMADGTLLELGYAGNNGHAYTPIARAMIEDGAIKRSELSLQTLRRYFQEHPDQVFHYAWRNDRYVFFQELAGGPYGSIGVPVTAFRSIATDKSVFPRACVAFLQANLPRVSGGEVVQAPYATFALDQDTGGAIRAAGRCDIWMGIGSGAEALAGRTGSEGQLYYVFVK